MPSTGSGREGDGTETSLQDPSRLASLRRVLARLVGPEVTVAVWGVDVLATDSYAVEELAVRGAVPKRQEEFRRGRACARAAMDSLGAAAEAIPVGPNREPVWPPGFVGSITHCGSVVAAAVAPADSLGGLGLDMERAEPLEPGVEGLVMLPAERAAAGAPWRGALVFSAKESVYKALFPLTRRWLGFEEVQLTLTSEGFQPTLIAPDPDDGMDPERGTDPELVSALRGSWAVEGGYVITVASLPVASVPRRP